MTNEFWPVGCMIAASALLSGCGNVGVSYPDVDSQLQLLSEFQQSEGGCSGGLTAQTGSSGEFDGAEASVCVGQISSGRAIRDHPYHRRDSDAGTAGNHRLRDEQASSSPSL